MVFTLSLESPHPIGWERTFKYDLANSIWYLQFQPSLDDYQMSIHWISILTFPFLRKESTEHFLDNWIKMSLHLSSPAKANLIIDLVDLSSDHPRDNPLCSLLFRCRWKSSGFFYGSAVVSLKPNGPKCWDRGRRNSPSSPSYGTWPSTWVKKLTQLNWCRIHWEPIQKTLSDLWSCFASW